MTASDKKLQETPDTADLFDVFVRLRKNAFDLARARANLGETLHEKVLSLLLEVAETILPRRIVIWDESVPLAEMHCKNKRLLAIDSFADGRSARSFDLHSVEMAADVLFELAQCATRVTTGKLMLPCHAEMKNGTYGVQDLHNEVFLSHIRCEIDALVQVLSRHALGCLQWSERSRSVEYSGAPRWNREVFERARRFRNMNVPGRPRKGSDAVAVQGIAFPLSKETLFVAGRDSMRGVAAVLQAELGMRAIERWQLARAGHCHLWTHMDPA